MIELINKNWFLLFITGIISFSYWVFSVVGNHYFVHYPDQWSDLGGILSIPITTFKVFSVLSKGLAFSINVFAFFATWFMIFVLTKLSIEKFKSDK
ncbi:MAG: hypothetical protein R2863_05310 [Candidatus Kapaibacterium sp.]|nr:hypothetical protein [Ignavibacteriota bacterium]MCB9221291.1 hypothetical protein [Ignavibacteria bacterium]